MCVQDPKFHMCQLIDIICQIIQEIEYLNAKIIIYRGTELNNIFLYEGLLMKTGNFGLAQQGGSGIFLKLFSAGEMVCLLCFLNGPIEDPNSKAIHQMFSNNVFIWHCVMRVYPTEAASLTQP